MRSLDEFFEECLSLGLTSNQRDFSTRMWSRSQNWFSSTLARQHERRLATEALLAFYFALTDAGCRQEVRAVPAHAHAVSQMRTEVWEEIADRVRG